MRHRLALCAAAALAASCLSFKDSGHYVCNKDKNEDCPNGCTQEGQVNCDPGNVTAQVCVNGQWQKRVCNGVCQGGPMGLCGQNPKDDGGGGGNDGGLNGFCSVVDQLACNGNTLYVCRGNVGQPIWQPILTCAASEACQVDRCVRTSGDGGFCNWTGPCRWGDGGACPFDCCIDPCPGNGTQQLDCRAITDSRAPPGYYCVPHEQGDPANGNSDCSQHIGTWAGATHCSGCPGGVNISCYKPMGPGDRGDPCGPDAGLCASGLCVDTGQGLRCWDPCSPNDFQFGGCDGGASCALMGGNPVPVCVPNGGFRRLATQLPSALRGLAPGAPGMAWVAGDDETLASVPLDGGLIANSSVSTGGESFAGVGATADTVCVLGGSSGGVYCGPKTVPSLPHAGLETIIAGGARSIAMPNQRTPSEVFALYQPDAGLLSVAILERDGGAWQPVATPGAPPAARWVAASPGGAAFTAAPGGQASVYNGTPQQQIPVGVPDTVAAIAFSDPAALAVDTSGQLYSFDATVGPDAGPAWVPNHATLPAPACLAGDPGGRVLAGSASGLWWGTVTGNPSGFIPWRGITGVAYVPNGAGGYYEVAVTDRGYVLVRP
jgi:hypothetical protein